MAVARVDWSRHEPTLRALWTAGKSCSQIAAMIGAGCTRNAVIGRVHRLKLTRSLWLSNGVKAGRKLRLDWRAKTAGAPSLAAVPALERPAMARPILALPKARGAAMPLSCEAPPCGVSFADWRPGQCLFFAGEPHGNACGAPARRHRNGEWSRWCAHHAAVVYPDGAP